jgi:FG-GAP-like repeat
MKRPPNCVVQVALGERLRRVPPSVFAWVCFALTLLAANSGPPVSAAPADVPVTAATPGQVRPPLSTAPQFRLGNAAKPFGWSTVIGDFNRDGQPDVAVADHVAHPTSGYRYRLEFSISGRAPQNVTFESVYEAVTIRVADVDHDDDLDVVVSDPLSGESVGVWLNDGKGRFSAGEIRQIPAATRPIQILNTADPSRGPEAFVVQPRRVDDGVPTLIHRVSFGSNSRVTISCTAPGIWSPFLCAGISPRAPPSASADVSSQRSVGFCTR